MTRSQEEILMRCKSIIGQKDIVSLVDKSYSPTAAYDMVMDATGDEVTARTARWLAVLRRDHHQAYNELVVNILRHAISGTAKKGEKNEKAVCS